MQPKPKNSIAAYVKAITLACVVSIVCYIAYSTYVIARRIQHIQAGLDIQAANEDLDQYLLDNKGQIPGAFANPKQLQQALRPYGLTSMRSSYDRSVVILFNHHLAGRNITGLASPATTVSFYESKTDIEGYRWVGFLTLPGSSPASDPPNASVQWLNEQAWRALRLKANL